MTVAELSAAVGSDRQHVGRILNGRRRPSARLRQKIAACLGVAEADAFPAPTPAVTVEMRIRELVDSAPPLTPEQRSRLAALLHPDRTREPAARDAAGPNPPQDPAPTAATPPPSKTREMILRATRASHAAHGRGHLSLAWWGNRGHGVGGRAPPPGSAATPSHPHLPLSARGLDAQNCRPRPSIAAPGFVPCWRLSLPRPCDVLEPDLQLVEVVVRRHGMHARLDDEVAELVAVRRFAPSRC
jgi:transcriptional regulator with XRE-family HTH domain